MLNNVLSFGATLVEILPVNGIKVRFTQVSIQTAKVTASHSEQLSGPTGAI